MITGQHVHLRRDSEEKILTASEKDGLLDWVTAGDSNFDAN